MHSHGLGVPACPHTPAGPAVGTVSSQVLVALVALVVSSAAAYYSYSDLLWEISFLVVALGYVFQTFSFPHVKYIQSFYSLRLGPSYWWGVFRGFHRLRHQFSQCYVFDFIVFFIGGDLLLFCTSGILAWHPQLSRSQAALLSRGTEWFRWQNSLVTHTPWCYHFPMKPEMSFVAFFPTPDTKKI